MRPRTITLISSIFIADACAILVMALIRFFGKETGAADVLVFSSFFIIPFLIGLLHAWQWRELKLKTSSVIGLCFISTLIISLFAGLFLGEGYICLIIVSPIILGMMCAGYFIGRIIYRKKNNTLNTTVFGIVLLVIVADVSSEHDGTNMVSDVIVVNAPVEKVWPYVVAYDPITLEEDYWLFKIGMPSPVQSIVDGYQQGAGRKCIFSNGYVFEEKMVVYKPNEELTFDITEQPRDPEIMGHIDITRGQFILKDNGDGTTTLIGNSWYKLYVFPEWYFNLWSESVTRNVHLRVMDHIKILSEKDV